MRDSRAARVFREGFSVFERHKDGPRSEDARHWLHEPGLPPSYSAAGRMRFLRTLEDASALQPGRILEVAAGGGLLSACLAEPGRQVVVNDLRDMSGELAQWNTATPLQFVGGSLFELDPKRIGTFDLVLACDVIEHVAHGDQFIAQLRRFISPGGHLILTTPNGSYFRSRLPTHSQITDFQALESKQFKPDADGHLFLYTRPELTGLVQAVGLTVERTYFSITPWVSGHAGFRWLPHGPALLSAYLGMDRVFSRFGRLCTQMTLIARN